MVAVLLSACGHRAVSGTGADALVFSSDSSTYSDSTVEVNIAFDYPQSGPQPLADSLSTYVCQQLGINSPSDDATFAKRKELEEEWQELAAADLHMQLYYTRNLTLLHDTTHYVTLQNSIEEFHGGAHGSYTYYGQTFRKSDGQRIGYVSIYDQDNGTFHIEHQTLFNDKVETPEFKALLKEGVGSYFKEMSNGDDDWTLEDMLIGVDDVNALPLPQYPPTFTKDGLSFVYQQYEIAPYAAGLPSFTIPYDKAKPFLTDDARALIP